MLPELKDPKEIATRAVQIESEKERTSFLDRECGKDNELRKEVEQIIAAFFRLVNKEKQQRNEDRDEPANERDEEEDREDPQERRDFPIERIGTYTVSKRLGEGAEGIVFQGEQHEPVSLRVAIKVLKDGLDWRKIVSRFEVERQVLLEMEHPNIAKLLGCGTLPSRRPYFVNELVEGPPITKYCDERKMSLPDRLQLFIAVCEAVQYAHQRGIIHGDLKPSNVLMPSASEEKEGEEKGDKKKKKGKENGPAPKILDFGMVQVLRGERPENAPARFRTGRGGKPEYLSPEQTKEDKKDLDTRSDVYSLGVLLYELLTSTTPLTTERLKDSSRSETLRLVREEEIPTPSARLNESKERLEALASKRQLKKGKKLLKAVRGELDCVVMKAMAKDPDNRYQTVHELMRDIQRHLEHQPLEACPPTGKRRVWLDLRQEKGVLIAVSAAALFLFVLAAVGTSVGIWALVQEQKAREAEADAKQKQEKAEQAEKEYKTKMHQAEMAQKATAEERDRAQKAEKAAQRAEEDTKTLLAFIKDKLLSVGRPSDVSLADAFWSMGKNRDTTLLKAVNYAASKAGEAFAERPLSEATIREMLGMAYLNLGDAKRAVEQYKRAFEFRKAIQGVNHPKTADCRNQLAVALRLDNEAGEASRLYHHNANSSDDADALAERGEMLLLAKKPADAEIKLRESLVIREKIEADHWTTFETKSLIGEALMDQKKYKDAEEFLLGGYEGMNQREGQIPAREKDRLIKAVQRLVRLYQVLDKEVEANNWRKELEKKEAAKQQ